MIKEEACGDRRIRWNVDFVVGRDQLLPFAEVDRGPRLFPLRNEIRTVPLSLM